MKRTLILRAHPYPARSLVTQALLNVLASQDHVSVRDLYTLYPDFDIDIQAEQQALLQADLIIWLTPVYWYSVPALMKHWFDQVLAYGWAYGHEAQALQGKSAWWIASAGAPEDAYTPSGSHHRSFDDFIAPIQNTAVYCGMHSLPHWVVHGGHTLSPQALDEACHKLLEQWRQHTAQMASPQRSHA
jgi:glutathione-regulated potassium-efflux system ancillary protein KefF